MAMAELHRSCPALVSCACKQSACTQGARARARPGQPGKLVGDAEHLLLPEVCWLRCKPQPLSPPLGEPKLSSTCTPVPAKRALTCTHAHALRATLWPGTRHALLSSHAAQGRRRCHLPTRPAVPMPLPAARPGNSSPGDTPILKMRNKQTGRQHAWKRPTALYYFLSSVRRRQGRAGASCCQAPGMRCTDTQAYCHTHAQHVRPRQWRDQTVYRMWRAGVQVCVHAFAPHRERRSSTANQPTKQMHEPAGQHAHRRALLLQGGARGSGDQRAGRRRGVSAWVRMDRAREPLCVHAGKDELLYLRSASNIPAPSCLALCTK